MHGKRLEKKGDLYDMFEAIKTHYEREKVCFKLKCKLVLCWHFAINIALQKKKVRTNNTTFNLFLYIFYFTLYQNSRSRRSNIF